MISFPRAFTSDCFIEIEKYFQNAPAVGTSFGSCELSLSCLPTAWVKGFFGIFCWHFLEKNVHQFYLLSTDSHTLDRCKPLYLIPAAPAIIPPSPKVSSPIQQLFLFWILVFRIWICFERHLGHWIDSSSPVISRCFACSTSKTFTKFLPLIFEPDDFLLFDISAKDFDFQLSTKYGFRSFKVERSNIGKRDAEQGSFASFKRRIGWMILHRVFHTWTVDVFAYHWRIKNDFHRKGVKALTIVLLLERRSQKISDKISRKCNWTDFVLRVFCLSNYLILDFNFKDMITWT